MEKKVRNWLELAKRDLAFAKDNVNRRNFRSYAPHFCHQALEKLLKALVVSKTDEIPPYIHNLVRLVNITKSGNYSRSKRYSSITKSALYRDKVSRGYRKNVPTLHAGKSR